MMWCSQHGWISGWHVIQDDDGSERCDYCDNPVFGFMIQTADGYRPINLSDKE